MAMLNANWLVYEVAGGISIFANADADIIC